MPNERSVVDGVRNWSPSFMGIIQVILLFSDLIINLIVDNFYSIPILVLGCLTLQAFFIVINLVLYSLGAAGNAVTTGISKVIVRHHEANLFTTSTYLALTVWWYIWTLRRSWPSISDQFTFSLISSTIRSQTEDENKSLSSQHIGLNMTDETGSVMEAYALWSPGYISLYVIQRTVAVIYFVVYLRSTFLLYNTSFEGRRDNDTYSPDDDEDEEEEEEDNETDETRQRSIKTISSRRMDKIESHALRLKKLNDEVYFEGDGVVNSNHKSDQKHRNHKPKRSGEKIEEKSPSPRTNNNYYIDYTKRQERRESSSMTEEGNASVKSPPKNHSKQKEEEKYSSSSAKKNKRSKFLGENTSDESNETNDSNIEWERKKVKSKKEPNSREKEKY